MAATDIKNDANLGASLTSCWLSDESGLTTDLVTGTGNDLTNNNTVALVAGVQGDAGDFERGSTEYLSIADGSQTGLDITSDFSFAAWINHETISTQNPVISKWSTSSNRSYFFDWNPSTLRLGVSDNGNGGGNTTVLSVAWSPSAATDYHIGVSYDVSAGAAIFYLDGSPLGTQQTGGKTSIHSGNAAFILGRASTTSGSYYDGIQNQVLVYDKILDATGFSDLYNSGSGIPFEGGAPPAAATNALAMANF